MRYERFESRFAVTETCSMWLMKSSLSLQPSQASLQIQVLMHCGRSSRLWSDLRPERRWKSLVSEKVSFHRNVSTTSLILLQPFEPIMKKTQPLLRNFGCANILNPQNNTFHLSPRMWTTKFQNSLKRLKRHEKISPIIGHLPMSTEVENTPITSEANRSRFKRKLNLLLTRIFLV